MRKVFLTALLAALIVPTMSFAMSFSTAPGYGAAAHLDPDPFLSEWLGVNGSLADGLTFSAFNPGDVATMNIAVTLDYFADIGSYEWLSVWADWNQDHVFDNSELIYNLNDIWFDNGTTNLAVNLNVPLTASLGSTWLRARITADGPLDPLGDYFTGEIEDHQIAVGDQNAIPEPTTMALFALGLMGAGVFGKKKISK